MRRFTTGFVAIALLLVGAVSLQAATEYTNIAFVEVQVADEDSSSNEFVEVYNPSSDIISLQGMLIQYRSASGQTWSTKATLEGEIAPRGRFLVSTYDEAAFTMRSGLANTGGSVRLYDEDAGHEYDRFAWGSAIVAEENMSIAAPTKTQSAKRLVNEDGLFLAGSVADSWFISDTPSPYGDSLPSAYSTDDSSQADDQPDQDAEEAQDESSQDDVEVISDPEVDTGLESDNNNDLIIDSDNSVVDDDKSLAQNYALLEITELFIDPDKPLTDAEDEYIELFNPGVLPLNAAGYSIETGTKFNYSFTIPEIVLAPGERVALYSIDTKLVLSNTAGAARIKNPAGEVIFTVPSYEKAKPDTVWTRNDAGEWGWSTEQTPGSSTTAVLAATASEAKAVLKASSAAKKVTTAAKKTASSDTDDNGRDVYQEPEEESAPINVNLLAGMGGLTVLYAGYEYRTDIANRIYQARRYVRRWGKTRPNS